MTCVIVGVDPHKRSVTIEAIDEQEKKVATGRFGNATRDYRAMLRYVRQQWPEHRWAIERAHGVGRPLAQRLLADGETVVDVPAKLAARVRVFDTGNARKTDATDTHAVAAAALRTPNLRVLSFDEELLALRLLVDRRDELTARRVQTVNSLGRAVGPIAGGLSRVPPGSVAASPSSSSPPVRPSLTSPPPLVGIDPHDHTSHRAATSRGLCQNRRVAEGTGGPYADRQMSRWRHWPVPMSILAGLGG
jgi:Transposase